MMKGYLDTVAQNTTVNVVGLPANAAGYDVYVYADGDNGGVTRTGTYQISGTSITTTSINLTDAANTNFSGTFTQASNSAGNYVVFSIAATGFTLTAIPSTASDGVERAPVNGMQIIPHAPAPDFTLGVSPSSQTVQAGNSTSYTATITAVNGFAGAVTFSASGLPSGANATFNPTSVTGSGSSTMTVTTASTTPTGTFTLTITGTSGTLRHTTTIALTVTSAPSYTLSASPTSLTMTQGGSGTSAIRVTPQNGFSGSVSLSASGLPSGVTASFSPNPTTTTSTLALAASSAATTGTVTVTITGTSGTLTNMTTITLTVTPPPPPLPSVSSLTLNPTSVVGGTQSSTGTVTLSGPAPAGGAQVLLSSSNGAASVPSSVTVPAGATSATFTVNTSFVLSTTSANISASYNGATQTASLTITTLM